jgi:hypothetical protein
VKAIAAALLGACLAALPAAAQEVTEPGSGARFAAKKGDLSLLGVGLRTRTIFQVKVARSPHTGPPSAAPRSTGTSCGATSRRSST